MPTFLKRLLTNAEFFVFGLVTIAFYFYFPRIEVFADSDEAWHISAGFLIRELGYIPFNDSWSFASDQQWYNISWAWDVFSSVVYQLVGDHFAIINAILYGFLIVTIYCTVKKIPGLKEDTINITTALAGIVIINSCLFRPQLASYFLAVYCLNLFTFSKSYDKRFIIKFAILIIVWVNFHGSILVPFSVVGAYFTEAYDKKNYAVCKKLIAIGFIGALCTLINPIGYHYYEGMLRTLNSEITAKIAEWHPFVFGINYGFTVALIIMLIVNDIKNKEINLSHKILTYAWLLAALASVRLMPFFIILSLMFFAKSINLLIKSSPRTIFTPKTYLPTLICCFAAFYFHNQTIHLANYSIEAPKAEIKYLAKHFPNIKILTDYSDGGFVIFYGKGKIKNFLDSRAGTAFSEETLNDFIAYSERQNGWESIVSKYDVQAVILKSKHFNNPELDKAFKGWYDIHLSHYGYILIRPDIYQSHTNK